MKHVPLTTRRRKLLVLAAILGLALTAIQSALPMRTYGVTRQLIETRHGFPVVWMVIDRRGARPHYHVEPAWLIPDFGFYFLVSAFILWGGDRIRTERRHRAGQCPACGYDLTGNESGVCPECGAPAQPRTQADKLAAH